MDGPASDQQQSVRPAPAGRLCYRLVWAVAAGVTALTFASATWIMPRHAALLAVASAIAMTLCATRALVLLARAAGVTNRNDLASWLRYRSGCRSIC